MKMLAKLQRSSRAFFKRHDTTQTQSKSGDNRVATATDATEPDAEYPPQQRVDKPEARLQPTAPQHKGFEVETLPSEVRRYLLSVLELPELKAFVRASPVYHQQYLFDRSYILRSSILESLGDVSVDAYAAHVCDPYTKETAEEGLNILESKLLLPKDLSQLALENMARFYFQNVNPLVEPFFSPVLGRLEKGIETYEVDIRNRSLLQSPPRKVEKLRLNRAIYRYQIFSLICSRSWSRGEWSTEALNAREERVERFVELSHPWEIEQLITLYECMLEPLEKICQDIDWQSKEYNPIEGGPFGSVDNWDHFFNSEGDGTALKGIPMLRSLVLDVLQHEDRVRLVHQHIVTEYTPFFNMDTFRGEYFQTKRRKSRPSHKDKLQASRAPLPFRGDSDFDAPPLGWTILWHGTYSNLCGDYNDVPLRKYGYVFWDAKRLEGTGAKELLEKICEWEFPDDDARESLYDEMDEEHNW